jgi:hypothetical protein
MRDPGVTRSGSIAPHRIRFDEHTIVVQRITEILLRFGAITPLDSGEFDE